VVSQYSVRKWRSLLSLNRCPESLCVVLNVSEGFQMIVWLWLLRSLPNWVRHDIVILFTSASISFEIPSRSTLTENVQKMPRTESCWHIVLILKFYFKVWYSKTSYNILIESNSKLEKKGLPLILCQVRHLRLTLGSPVPWVQNFSTSNYQLFDYFISNMKV
jgi:hypothetical protein